MLLLINFTYVKITEQFNHPYIYITVGIQIIFDGTLVNYFFGCKLSTKSLDV